MRPVDVVVLCPPGFEDIVAEAAARELPKVSESVRTSGFVRVRTDASVQQLRAFRCATNVFAVLCPREVQKQPPTVRGNRKGLKGRNSENKQLNHGFQHRRQTTGA